MMYVFNPSTDYRYSLKKGMQGTDVAALQLNLNDVIVDGDFGQQTEDAVIEFQSNKKLLADGIAGPTTQRKMVVNKSRTAEEQFSLPQDTLKSLAANESNFIISAVSHHPSDSGLDIGPFQFSTGHSSGNQAFYEFAYDIKRTAFETAKNMRETKSRISDPIDSRYFDELANNNPKKFKWLMAILNHNWPDAAEDIPRYGVIYEHDLGRDDEPANWIIQASGGRISTPRQWVYSYLERATVYIKW